MTIGVLDERVSNRERAHDEIVRGLGGLTGLCVPE